MSSHQKKKIKDRFLFDSLTGDDKKLVLEAKKNFLVIFLSIFIAIALAIGISVPVILSSLHDTRVNHDLTTALNKSIDTDFDDFDAGEFDLDELSWASNIFSCRIPSSALEDGKVEADEIEWLFGENNFSEELNNNAEYTSELFARQDRTADFNIVYLSGANADMSYYYLVGNDITDFNNYFYPSIITLEVLLVVSTILLGISAYFLANLIFRPVVSAMVAQRQFVGDASHELKTPLAVIKADCEVLLRQLGDDSPSATWINAMKDQADRMTATIQELVTLSSLDSSFHIQQEVDMTQIVNDVCLSFDAVCFEKGIDYNLEHLDLNVKVKCDPEYVRKLLEELLNNAVKYASGKPPKIRVYFTLEKGYALLKISNTGCNIKAEDIPHVFDRFYRTAEMRASTKGGTGLGLSICKAIADKNGFTISVDAKYDEETSFIVKMPLA